MNVSVRHRDSSDAYWLADAWHQYMEDLSNYCPAVERERNSLGRFALHAMDGQTRMWIAIQDSERVGFAVIGDAEEPDFVPGALELRDLWVDPGKRSRGLGQQLVAEIVAIERAPQWEHFVYKRNTRSQAFVTKALNRLGGTTEGPYEITYEGCDAVYWRHTPH